MSLGRQDQLRTTGLISCVLPLITLPTRGHDVHFIDEKAEAERRGGIHAGQLS